MEVASTSRKFKLHKVYSSIKAVPELDAPIISEMITASILRRAMKMEMNDANAQITPPVNTNLDD